MQVKIRIICGSPVLTYMNIEKLSYLIDTNLNLLALGVAIVI